MLDPGCGFCYRENGSALLTSSCVPVNKASTEQAAWGRWVTGCCTSMCVCLGCSRVRCGARIIFRVLVQCNRLMWNDTCHHGIEIQCQELLTEANELCLPLPDAPTPAWWEIKPTGHTTTVLPPTPGWFYWAWCFTWLLSLQVRDQILVFHLSFQCHL